jgi:AraC-like DNA-binding protein
LIEGTVSAGLAASLLELAVERGASRDELLRRSAIGPDELANPDNRIEFERYVGLMRHAKSMSGDSALALHFGDQVELRDFSVMGGLVPPSGRPIDGLSLTNRFAPLLIDVPISGATRFEMCNRDDGLWLVDTRSEPNCFPELTESTFARMVAMCRRHGASDAIREIRVTHPAPDYRNEYDEVLQVSVSFGCERNELRIDRSVLEQVHAPPTYANSVLLKHAEELLAELGRSQSTRSKVERILIPQIAESSARVDTVAYEMGLSRQTLHRRLKDEGTSFERIRDELRRELALRSLTRDEISAGQLAAGLGFSDRSAFERAFKRWTGVGPAAWKKVAWANG